MRRAALLAVASLMLATLGGHAVAAPSDAAAGIPDEIKARGVLRVGSQQTFPPVEFRKPGKAEVTGVSRELLDEIARRLGLKIQFVQAEYAALIPGLDANRFDIASGGLSDTDEREAKVDFVNYMYAGASILTLSKHKGTFNTIDDFCGRAVATMLGSRVIMSAVDAASARCTKAGKPAIRAEQLPGAPDARQQVDLMRVDGYIGDVPALAYLRQQFPGRYQIVGGDYRLTTYIASWGFNKRNPGLRDAVHKAAQSMLADGTYRAILTRWSLADAALPAITINLPASKRK